jgi:hypothetical protein
MALTRPRPSLEGHKGTSPHGEVKMARLSVDIPKALLTDLKIYAALKGSTINKVITFEIEDLLRQARSANDAEK